MRRSLGMLIYSIGYGICLVGLRVHGTNAKEFLAWWLNKEREAEKMRQT